MKYQLDEPCIKAPGKPHEGYIQIYPKGWGGKGEKAHRYAYMMIYGPPPPDKPWILHKCDNKECWNPSHLYAGTNADNMRDAVASRTQNSARKTHCPKGHEYSSRNSQGRRICKICNRETAKRQYKKNKKAGKCVSCKTPILNRIICKKCSDINTRNRQLRETKCDA